MRRLIERAGGPRTVDVWDLRIAQDTARRAARDICARAAILAIPRRALPVVSRDIAAARAVRTPETDPWDVADEEPKP